MQFDYELDSERHWNELHRQPRFRPQFPSDPIISFLKSNFPVLPIPKPLKALDIGVGGGRHTKLLCDFGFDTYGIDISKEGIEHCRSWLASVGKKADLKVGSMRELPFNDESFDVAIAWGVFNYADLKGLKLAVSELYRVLKPDGLAFVMTRTANDYRYGQGEQIEPGTFRLSISDTNEQGSIQHFVEAKEVRPLFSAFSQISIDKNERTFNDGKRLDSDWLISLKK